MSVSDDLAIVRDTSGPVAELVKRASDLLSWVENIGMIDTQDEVFVGTTRALREAVDAFDVRPCYWPIEACICGECGPENSENPSTPASRGAEGGDASEQ